MTGRVDMAAVTALVQAHVYAQRTRAQLVKKGDPGDPGLLFAGDWKAGEPYQRTSLVSHARGAWFALQDDPTGEPGQDAEQWFCLVPAPRDGETGPVGLNPCGDWVAGQTYSARSLVSYERAAWMAVVDGASGKPSDQSDAWLCLVPAGERGPRGFRGDPGLVNRGAWSDQLVYDEHDLVRYGASIWVSLVSGNADTPSEASENWHLLVRDGLPGEKGSRGERGLKGDQGLQGAAGMVWRGKWDRSSAYPKDSVVGHKGSSWIAIAAKASSEPSDKSSEWDLVASKGEDGQASVIFSSGAVSGGEGSTGGPALGVPTFMQQADPALATPYIWFKTDGSGAVIDILTGP